MRKSSGAAGQRRDLGIELRPDARIAQSPRTSPGALTPGTRLERRSFVEVATAFGGPFAALGAVAVAALVAAFDLGRGPLEAGADLLGLDLGGRALVALGGLPAALPESAGDHDPVTLAEGVGQVLGLPPPLAVRLRDPGLLGKNRRYRLNRKGTAWPTWRGAGLWRTRSSSSGPSGWRDRLERDRCHTGGVTHGTARSTRICHTAQMGTGQARGDLR